MLLLMLIMLGVFFFGTAVDVMKFKGHNWNKLKSEEVINHDKFR